GHAHEEPAAPRRSKSLGKWSVDGGRRCHMHGRDNTLEELRNRWPAAVLILLILFRAKPLCLKEYARRAPDRSAAMAREMITSADNSIYSEFRRLPAGAPALSLACALEFRRHMSRASIETERSSKQRDDGGYEQGISDCTRPDGRGEQIARDSDRERAEPCANQIDNESDARRREGPHADFGKRLCDRQYRPHHRCSEERRGQVHHRRTCRR